MATPNIVPRSDSEGGIGTASKYWASAYIDTITTTSHINLPDNAKARFGTGTDLQIYHDGSDNYIKADGLGHLYIQQGLNDGDIIFSSDDGSGGITEYFRLDGGLTTLEFAKGAVFNTGSYVKLMDGITLFVGTGNDLRISHDSNHSYISQEGTGALFIRNTTDDADIILQSDDGSGGQTSYLTLDGSIAKTKVDRPLLFADNISAEYGAGTDMIMYHSGSNGFIENYNGNFTIIQHTNDADIIFKCDDGSGSTTAYLTLDGGEGHTIVHKEMQFQNNVVARFGNSNAGQIYHSSSVFQIDNIIGNMAINNFADDGDIIFSSDNGAGGTATYFFLDGSSATHDGSATTALYTNWPDFSRISLGTGHDMLMYHDGAQTVYQNRVGNFFITNSADDSDIIFQCDDGSGGVTPYITLDGGAAITLVTKEMRFGDSVPLKLGAGPDFEMSHDGTNTNITNKTGTLFINQDVNDGDIIFRSDDGTGGVAEYFKLDGSIAGGDGAGTLFTIWPDNSRASFGDNADLRIYHDGTDTKLLNLTGNVIIQNNADDKDISFSCDNGAGATSTYFRLDGSAAEHDGSATTALYTNWPDFSRISMGTGHDLQIEHNSTDSVIRNATGDLYIQQNANNKDIIFQNDDGSGGVETYFFLDGSATSGSPVTVFPDNSILYFGDGLDFSIGHNGSNSVITNTGGNVFIDQQTDNGSVYFRCDDGSGGITNYFQVDGSAELNKFHKNTKHTDGIAATFGDGGDLSISHDSNNSYITANGTGDLYIKQMTDDKDIYFQSDDGSGGVATYFQLDGGEGHTIVYKEINFQDAVRSTFGASNDLQVYHDGSNSYIQNETGILYIWQGLTDGDISFVCDDGSGGETEYFRCDGGDHSITFNKEIKLASDSHKLTIGASRDLQILHDGTNSHIANYAGHLIIANNSDNSDIIFQNDDGSGGLTTYFKLDGSHSGNPITLFPDNSQLHFGDGFDFRITHDGSQSILNNQTGNLEIVNNSDDGDIFLKSDAGDGTTTPYIHLDGSEVSTKILTQKVIISNLPTSDPSNAGQLWNDSGTLKISAG